MDREDFWKGHVSVRIHCGNIYGMKCPNLYFYVWEVKNAKSLKEG